MPISTKQFPPAVTELLCSNKTILVGVSGGRDSVALLHLLNTLQGCQLVVCHVHHGLRAEADEESEFVRNMAATLNLPFHTARVNVSQLATQHGLSTEDMARKVRQELFEKWSQNYPNVCVALAHHRNDQQETALLHLCRGAASLRGMKSISTWPNGLCVVRPLLAFTRAEITAYLTQRKLPWRDDASNNSTEYTRNALRHRVIPVLNELFNRDTSLTFARACHLNHLTHTALTQALEAMNLLDPQGRLYLPKVHALPPELKQCAVHHYLSKQNIPDLSEAVVLRVMSILNINGPSRTSLPGNKLAIRKEKRLIII